MSLDLGTLQGHVDLDVAQFESKYRHVDQLLRRLATTTIPDVQVSVDATTAQSAITRLGTQLGGLQSMDPRIQVDMEIADAQADVAKIEAELAALRSAAPTIQVQADIDAAERKLSSAQAQLGALQGARAKLTVTADTSDVDDKLGDVEDQAAASGAQAGEEAGSGLAGGIIAAIATIPVAGAIVGIGAAIGEALLDGLQNEVRADRFMAQTGLDGAAAEKFGRAAGEAYANNFGESIEGNLDIARTAIQAGLLDPAATKADAQAIIEQLTGVADIMGEEIPAVAKAAARAIQTGIAKDAAGAFDLLVRGTQQSLNVSEDLIDTVNEYGTQFRKLGLEGPQAFGLMAQAVRAGARDTDLAADAMKEFSIRAIDGSDASIAAYEALGLSAQEMTDTIAAGGPAAADALGAVLDKLREVEDPAERAQIAVGLFGTQAEDLGDALYAMDLSTAVEQFGLVEGSASRAIDTLGDNSAGKIASAQRNIEVAADGIKGALATAFSPQIEGFATFVSTNREAVLNFLLDAANAGIDFTRALINGAANATEGFGNFIGIVGPGLFDMIETALVGFARLASAADPTGILGYRDAARDAAESFHEVKESANATFANVDSGAAAVAETMRTNLIEKGLDPAQQKLNELAIPMVAEAALNDATGRLASGIDGVGMSGALAMEQLTLLNGVVDTSTESGREYDAQIRGVVAALDEQLIAAAGAGESQEQLTGRVNSARDAFINQMTAIGLTGDEAAALADQYGLIPSRVDTLVDAATEQATQKIGGVQESLFGIRDKTVTIDGRRSAEFEATRNAFLGLNDKTVTVTVRGGVGGTFSDGGFTGPGGKYDPAGLVHKGEFVFDQEKTARYRPLFEAIHNDRINIPGFAGGGFVGSVAAPSAPATVATGPAPSRTYNVTVNNYGPRALSGRDVVNAIRDEERLGV